MLQRMLNRLRGANDDEKGFTLIELLVVILIIGILAAIALPTFLGQQKKAQDSAAKSDARNAVTQIESCLADATSSTASACGTSANTGLAALKLITSSSASLGTNGGPTFTVTATSRSSKTYSIAKTDGAAAQYSTTNTDDAKWTEANTAPSAPAAAPTNP